MPGFDGCMGREDAFGLGLGQGLSISFSGGNFFADQFEREKRRMPFVHVEH